MPAKFSTVPSPPIYPSCSMAKFELVINMTAGALGLTVPPTPQQFRSERGSIPVGAIVKTGTAFAVPAAEGACCFIWRANSERHLAGISVGIGSNRRRKLSQIQLVMVLGNCRPGAPEAFRTDPPPSGNSHPISDVTVLIALKPMLRGLVREHADLTARDCGAPICTMPFCAA